MYHQSLQRHQPHQQGTAVPAFHSSCRSAGEALRFPSRRSIGTEKQQHQQQQGLLLRFRVGRHATPAACAATQFTPQQVALGPFDQSLTKIFESQDDHSYLLKRKTYELKANLKGTRIFLIGMMGSGKTTVGKLVAEALDYKFLDSDTMIEEAAGGMTVAQIFQDHDEETFRKFETEALMGLTNKDHLVVATGGGIVVRPINWNYMRHGLTVYLDVPLEALAERVVAVGTGSRPMLGLTEDDSAHSKALAKLSSIFESRGPLYSEADVTISLHKLALYLGFEKVQELTPRMIAVQVLEELYKHIVQRIQNIEAAPAA